MNGLWKGLSLILGILAVLACLATVGIIGYSVWGSNDNRQTVRNDTDVAEETDTSEVDQLPSPSQTTGEVTDLSAGADGSVQVTDSTGHTHKYVESIETLATCKSAGKLKYTCSCGDYYYVDIHATGHVADDWETLREATASQSGLRVQKCIYCDEIMAQEVIPYTGTDSATTASASPGASAHVHSYVPEVMIKPTCTQAGTRKYTCSCGSFYTEFIPAVGHVPTVWTQVKAATTAEGGIEQRTCSVCLRHPQVREHPHYPVPLPVHPLL